MNIKKIILGLMMAATYAMCLSTPTCIDSDSGAPWPPSSYTLCQETSTCIEDLILIGVPRCCREYKKGYAMNTDLGPGGVCWWDTAYDSGDHQHVGVIHHVAPITFWETIQSQIYPAHCEWVPIPGDPILQWQNCVVVGSGGG